MAFTEWNYPYLIIVFSSLCLDQITVQYPKHPLQGRVEKDVRNGYKQIGIAKEYKWEYRFYYFMILGLKYLKYYPEYIFQLPSDLYT